MKAFELIQRKFGRRNKEYAILGDFNGNVLVAGYKTLNYARVHGVVQLVWNRICDPKPGIEVEIEYQGTQIVVVGLRGRAYPTTDELPLNQAHADEHLEGEKDPVYIWMSQILNLRIVPNGFTIKIWQGRHYGVTWKAPARSSAWNLASYQPVSGAVWVLIYVKRDGTFALVEGETADSVSLLVPSLIPPLPFGAWAIAAVRLYSAQTAIDGIKDIYDLRWAAAPYNAASGSIEATIASGAITAYSHYIRVYGEGDAADDLATINGGAHGSWVILLAPDGGTAPVTVKNGTGNIVLPADFMLGGASTALALFYDDEQDKWLPFGTGVSASSVTYSVVTKIANYTITDADDYVLCDATSGNITITMPAAAGRTGRLFTIKKIDTSANTVIITGIYTLTVENQAITLLSTGAAWLATSDRYEVFYPTLVINDAGAASGDFRAESDTEENMILLDASADALYLGGTTNGVKIDKGGGLTPIGTGALNVDTTNFTGNLSAADNSVQKALDTLDDMAVGVDKFVDLTDGPGAFAGNANKIILVNSLSNGLNYGETYPLKLANLGDGPAGGFPAGSAGYLFAVHSSETSFEYIPRSDLLKVNVTLYVDLDHAAADDGNPGTDPDLPLVTIQAAVDKFKGYVVSNCVIEIAAGTYVENVVVASISVPMATDLNFNGDDARICVGCCYMHGGVLASSGNRGGGTMSLATGGGGGSAITITVTGSTANPAFGTDGIASGDKLFTWNGTSLTEYNVASVSGNIITLVETTTAPALNTNGRFMVIEPAVRIVPASGIGFRSDINCKATGVYAKGTVLAGFYILSDTFILNRCLGYCTATGDTSAGIFADRAAYLTTSDPTMGMGYNGLTLRDGCNATVPYGHWYGTTRGVYCLGSQFDASNCGVAVGPSTAGMYAWKNGYIYAAGVAARNFAATKWSPATTDTSGNNMAAITFS